MNTDTGKIYRGEEEIAAAQRRGEPLEILDSDAKDWEIRAMEARSAQIQATRQALSVGKRKKLKL